MPARTHGMTKSPEYRTWRGMNSRCHCASDGSYALYGGRGIFVCPEWRGAGGFDAFFAYMGFRPDGHEIDRIDGGRGYEPGNVRWVTRAENERNKSPETRKRIIASLHDGLRKFYAAGGEKVQRALRRQHKPRRQPARLLAVYAWNSLRRNGNVLGVSEQHKLMAEVRDALVEQFGPPRNMPEPKPGEFSIEQAFLESDFSLESEHFAGVATDPGHRDWDALRVEHLQTAFGFGRSGKAA